MLLVHKHIIRAHVRELTTKHPSIQSSVAFQMAHGFLEELLLSFQIEGNLFMQERIYKDERGAQILLWGDSAERRHILSILKTDCWVKNRFEFGSGNRVLSHLVFSPANRRRQVLALVSVAFDEEGRSYVIRCQ